jgi:hypothetical protein
MLKLAEVLVEGFAEQSAQAAALHFPLLPAGLKVINNTPASISRAPQTLARVILSLKNTAPMM